LFSGHKKVCEQYNETTAAENSDDEEEVVLAKRKPKKKDLKDFVDGKPNKTN
jgi:hypothetical protein